MIWDVLEHPHTLLLSSCTDLTSEDSIIRGRDCINGTVMPAILFEDFTNFTTLMNVFQVSKLASVNESDPLTSDWSRVLITLLQGTGHNYKLDQPDKVSGLPRGTHIPFDTDIKIFNRYMCPNYRLLVLMVVSAGRC